MPQIISAISGMKLESGFAYLCSKPQPDIGRTLQTHIHDSTEILFLVSFTAPGWTVATRSTNVMQIRCVAMPPLHRYTHTDPHTHTADSCGHGSSNSGWKRLYCPCINGFKRGLRATVYSITSSIFPSLLPETGDIRTGSKQAWDLYSPQTQKLTQLCVNMGSQMKPWA